MTELPAAQVRTLLSRMFEAAVAAAHPRACLPRHLPEPPADGRLICVGAGKAAAAMAEVAARHYQRVAQAPSISGAVVTRYGAAAVAQSNGIDIGEAGHPVPDANSVKAAQRALALARSATVKDQLLCLLSGGASALWSAPVNGVSLQDMQTLTGQLLAAGAPIDAINCVRKHLSLIQGGRLAIAAAPASVLTLAISDVPGDDPATIGSGPTVPDPSTLEQARASLARYVVSAPKAITRALATPGNETPKPDDPQFAAARYRLIATPRVALEAAATVAAAAGFDTQILGDAIEGEAREVAKAHAALALNARRSGRPIAIISGGELTVTVRGDGAGGPNQEYALALAIALAGAPGIYALAGDTDGIDGGGGSAHDPAGAVITPSTLRRAAARSIDSLDFLNTNNATGFFTALGDLLRCGATGTNVNDFRAILVTGGA